MKEAEMDIVADFIRKVYNNYDNEEQLSKIKKMYRHSVHNSRSLRN